MKKLLLAISMALVCTYASAQGTIEARAFLLPACPVDPTYASQFETGLGTVIVAKAAGSLVGAGIDALASVLSEDRSFSRVATNRAEGWYVKSKGSTALQRNAGNKCLVVTVSEEFGEISAGAMATSDMVKNFADGLTVLKDAKNQAGYDSLKTMQAKVNALAKIGITAPPRFYLEAALTQGEGPGKFTLQPTFIHYPSFIGDKVLFGGNTRDLLLQVDFSTPGETQAFASITVLKYFGLQPGTLTTKRVRGLTHPWSSPPSSEGVPAAEEGSVVPFNINVLFTETAKPGALGKALASAAKSVKDDVVTEVENKVKYAISATERQAARSRAAEAANTALTTYLTAYDDLISAQKAFDEAAVADKPKFTAKLQLRKAQFKNAGDLAQAAFSAANIPFTPISGI
jgi:hypothetical protein